MKDMGNEKASAAKQNEGDPVDTPMNNGRGRRVSIVNLDVNVPIFAIARSMAAPLMTNGPSWRCILRLFFDESSLLAPSSIATEEDDGSTLLPGSSAC